MSLRKALCSIPSRCSFGCRVEKHIFAIFNALQTANKGRRRRQKKKVKNWRGSHCWKMFVYSSLKSLLSSVLQSLPRPLLPLLQNYSLFCVTRSSLFIKPDSAIVLCACIKKVWSLCSNQYLHSLANIINLINRVWRSLEIIVKWNLFRNILCNVFVSTIIRKE